MLAIKIVRFLWLFVGVVVVVVGFSFATFINMKNSSHLNAPNVVESPARGRTCNLRSKKSTHSTKLQQIVPHQTKAEKKTQISYLNFSHEQVEPATKKSYHTPCDELSPPFLCCCFRCSCWCYWCAWIPIPMLLNDAASQCLPCDRGYRLWFHILATKLGPRTNRIWEGQKRVNMRRPSITPQFRATLANPKKKKNLDNMNAERCKTGEMAQKYSTHICLILMASHYIWQMSHFVVYMCVWVCVCEYVLVLGQTEQTFLGCCLSVGVYLPLYQAHFVVIWCSPR